MGDMADDWDRHIDDADDDDTPSEMPSPLLPEEVEVLEMLAGKRPGEWGAWVSVSLEFLQGRGYCTPGPDYQITPLGRLALTGGDND